MHRIILTCLVLAFSPALVEHALAADTKTAPARDVFVENSTTDFILTAKAARGSGKSKLAFDLSAPVTGDYTLVSFIDGKPWKPAKFTSPGTFELSTRGMAPGSYRVTLQLVDAQGRVGSATQTIRLK